MNDKEINNYLNKNQRLIQLIAKKAYVNYFSNLLDLDDVTQQANLFAIEYLKSYDPSRGKISTYLYNTVGKRLITHLRKNMYPVKIPIHIFDKLAVLKSYCNKNNKDINKISVQDISEYIDISKQCAEWVYLINKSEPMSFSIDDREYFSNDTIEDRYNKIDYELDKQDVIKKVNKYLQGRNPLYTQVLKDLYFNDLTLEEAGKKYNRGRESARRKSLTIRHHICDRFSDYKEIF